MAFPSGISLPWTQERAPTKGALRHETYTVVGTADSPLYIGVERALPPGTGKVAFYVLLPEEAFDMEAYTDATCWPTGPGAAHLQPGI